MDIERKNLEILFREIPYDHINLIHILNGRQNTYDHVDKSMYLEYARRIFPYCSEDERINNYLLLCEEMQECSEKNLNIFSFIYNISSKMLTLQSGEIQCRLNEMLRWREISFQLGQEFFTCAFLAGENLRKGNQTKFFAWQPIISSDDVRLNNILKREIAENHFHLNGSTKIFELNWICLMNHIENRGKEFKRFDIILQHDYVNEAEKKSFYEMCQEAALYRGYLFSVICENQFLIEQMKKIIVAIEKKMVFLWEKLSEIQDLICLTGSIYGAVNEHGDMLDYALLKSNYDCNNNSCRLLAGERWLLYESYQNCLKSGNTGFSDFDKNIFYRYLVLRTFFRSEMIQVNKMVGFSNFDQYQLRKEYFIEGKRAYENELVRLAVNASFEKQNICSLEARICPDIRSDKLARKINNKIECIKDENIKEKLFFVLHFPKQKDVDINEGEPRNSRLRKRMEKYTNAIVALLEKEGEVNRYIRGIDACANEIGCRPEVFAQYYRYLLDYSYKEEDGSSHNLMATYHVGEDFFDIVDGLRAIDEVMLFCGIYSGCRLGHALALGINTENYYKYKGDVLVTPGQDLLDNLAWILVKQCQYGCLVDDALKFVLEHKFNELFNEIYYRKELEYGSVTYLEYYNCWKLRGDCPDNYCLDEKEFSRRLELEPVRKLQRYEFNSAVSDTLRKNSKYRELYMHYHYDTKIRKNGDKEVVFKVPCGYADLVKNIQDAMIKELVQKGIGIETNPSSNYLIGPIKKYNEHPIIRFNGRKLKKIDTNMALQVSINTDDQGVFDTSLENEYAIMTIALKKTKDENNQLLYDLEDIYAWIDYVRRMGITQSFK